MAYQNMIKAEGGDKFAEEKIDDLFKTQIVIDEMADDVLNLLLDNNISYDKKKSIHPQTLKKYCQGKLDQGELIPEGISKFEYTETKIIK